jgi:hypothetical protein
MANNSISLVNLDFDTLKTQLKTYLRAQPQFTDYDFDGSNMSVLLDILTYNSHLNAFYLNMVLSEMFIDSAQLRGSVASIAKALNYTPRSARSSKATITARFPQSGLSTFTIPRNTRFTGRNSQGSFQFLTNETVVLFPVANAFVANNLDIFEGSRVVDTFVLNRSVENQRFIISNSTVDTDSIEVFVSETGGITQTEYTKAISLFDLDAQSKIYFVQATDTSYEVVFGDGVFGSVPADGSIISVSYRISSGTAGNDCTNFILNDNLGAVNGFGSSIIPSITVLTNSIGGAAEETIEEIRFRAPRSFQTQERAITVNDFITTVTQQFPAIRTINAYGGEEVLDAPRFGTVYIVPITFTGELLSQEERRNIEAFLKTKTNLGVTPVVINPEFLFVDINTVVRYNPSGTSLTGRDIETLVKQAIEDFNETQIREFNSELNLSKLQTEINDASDTIVGNQTSLLIRKVFTPRLGERVFPLFNFRNEIVPGTVISSAFNSAGRILRYTDVNPQINTLEVTFDTMGANVLNTTNVLYLSDVTNPSTVTYSVAGEIDYTNGVVTMNSIIVTDLQDTPGIELTARPKNDDIFSTLNDVINIDSEVGIKIEVSKIQ